MRLFMFSSLSSERIVDEYKCKKNEKILVLAINAIKEFTPDNKSFREKYLANGKIGSMIISFVEKHGGMRNNISVFNHFKYGFNTMIEKISQVDTVFILGGDPRVGMDFIEDSSAFLFAIKNKTIVAFSAGALMLCKNYFLSPNWYFVKPIYELGLGLVDILIDVHYDESPQLIDFLSETANVYKKDIIALSNGAFLSFSEDLFFVKGDYQVFHPSLN